MAEFFIISFMKISLIIIALLACSLSIAAQTATKEFSFKTSGKTVDAEKKPYVAMYLEFIKDGFKTSAISDENGDFSADLPAGKYEVRASEATSKTFLAFLDITEKGPNPTGVEFTIGLNEGWCSNCAAGKMPEVIKYVEPIYPPTATAVGATGEVVVAIKVGKDGKVISAQWISGHPLLRAVSQNAAKNWTFSVDENVPEREGKLVFAFTRCNENRKDNKFRKPNRVEMSATCPIVETYRVY
jgi:hypothetical protein